MDRERDILCKRNIRERRKTLDGICVEKLYLSLDVSAISIFDS